MSCPDLVLGGEHVCLMTWLIIRTGLNEDEVLLGEGEGEEESDVPNTDDEDSNGELDVDVNFQIEKVNVLIWKLVSFRGGFLSERLS